MSKKLAMISEKTKVVRPQTCQGCLSFDRVLFSIKQPDDLYQIIVDNHLFNKKKNISLCWECVAVLKKMKLFKEQVRNAESILLLQKRSLIISEPKSLSKLTKYTLTEHNTLEMKFADVKTDVHILFDNVNVDNTVNDNCQTDAQYNGSKMDAQHSDRKVELEIIPSGTDEAKLEVKLEMDDADDFCQSDYEDVTIKQENTKHEEKPKRKLKHLARLDKYTWVLKLKKEFIEKVKINCDDIDTYMAMERSSQYYLDSKFKCDKCVIVFKTEDLMKEHSGVHNNIEPYKCPHCDTHHDSDISLHTHIRSHLTFYRCKGCAFQSCNKNIINKHVKFHKGCIKCNLCGCYNINVRHFYEHYKEYHTEFICDYCNVKKVKKESLEKHIRNNHSKAACHICGLRIKYDRLKQHIERVHTINRSERAFCVACNKQFDNELKFLTHFYSLHKTPRKKQLKCPDCDKVYTRQTYLNNHYRMAHDKKTKHHCALCDKYFLNGWRYREHYRYKHEGKVRPKHILCNLCGRGFSSNTILIRHIRTHTGERPFKCTTCDAAFTQKNALQTHVRCVHRSDRNVINDAFGSIEIDT